MPKSHHRVRTRGGHSLKSGWLEQKRWESCSGPTSWTDNYWFPAPTEGELSTMEDIVERDFWERSRNGEYIVHPMAIEKVTKKCENPSDFIIRSTFLACTSPPHYAEYREIGAVFAAIAGEIPEFYLLNAPDMSRLEKQVRTECLAKRNGQAKANYLESLAECREAFSMLSNPLENVRRFADSFQRKPYKPPRLPKAFKRWSEREKQAYRRKVARAAARFAASEWLRFRYGVFPMIRDFYALLETLRNVYGSKPRRLTTRARGSISAAAFETVPVHAGVLWIDRQRSTQHFYDIRACYVDEVTPTHLNDLGFNIQNLMGLPWELAKRSFVLDWFANVGDFIYANLPRVNMKALGGMMTAKDTLVTSYSPGAASVTGPYVLDGVPSDRSSKTRMRKRRSIMTESTHLLIKTDFGYEKVNRVLDTYALMTRSMVRITQMFSDL